MSRLSDFHATGVNFPDVPRLDVDELVGAIPDDGTLHLAILQQPYLGLIESGTKTIESRFNTRRAAPYGRVAVGDLILLKEPGLPVSHYFFADAVELIQLASVPIDEVRRRYGEAIGAQDDNEFWRRHENSRYGTLVSVGERGLISPSLLVAKKDQRGWVTFTRDTDEPLTLF